MNSLALVKSLMPTKLGRVGLILRKKSPEIMITLGVVGLSYSVWKIAKAEPKARKIKEEYYSELAEIEEVKDHLISNNKDYTDNDYIKDRGLVAFQAGVDLVKLYGPPVVLGAVSVACIFGSHIIMRNRNIALMAAYTAIDDAFKRYRKRVVEDYGEEVDRRFRLGMRQQEIVVEEEDEKGKKKKVKKNVDVVDPNGISVYARFFGKGYSSEWVDTPNYNLSYIKGQQSFFNQLLHSRGHVFLNEVYDALGFKRSKEGALVGWVLGNGGDDFIDFSIYNCSTPEYRNEYSCDTIVEERQDFVNGYRDSILLDFNVDGLIYDKI